MHTHNATIILPSAVTGRTRAHVRANGSDLVSICAAAREQFPEHMKDVKDSAVVVERVAKVPTPKLGVKYTQQHDYLMLTATYPDGVFRLTVSFGGEKMSGDFVSDPRAKALFRKVNTAISGDVTPLKAIKAVQAAAERSKTASELFAATLDFS